MSTQAYAKHAHEEAPAISFQNDVFADVTDLDEDSRSNHWMEEPNPHARRLDVETIVLLTARLAQVLAEETDLLGTMRIKEIEKLQKEKLVLVEALEKQKRLVERRPELLSTMSDEECLELAQVIEIFQAVMKENHRHLLIAREVNRKVVEAISDVVTEAAQHQIYDHKGAPEASTTTIALSLDKRI